MRQFIAKFHLWKVLIILIVGKIVLGTLVGLIVDHLDHKNKDELVEALHRLQSDQAIDKCIEQNCRGRKNEVDLNLYNQQLEKKVRALLS